MTYFHDGALYEDLDLRDKEILAKRQAMLDELQGPRVGDFVVFADGVTHRFSYDWGPELGIQHSAGGSYYLGEGYVSMSGALDHCVPYDTLALVEDGREGSCWFFHHDRWQAHNGVDVTARFRVFTCTLTSKEAR